MGHEDGHYGQLGRVESAKRYYKKNKEIMINRMYDLCECGKRKSKASERCWECYKRLIGGLKVTIKP